MYNIIYDIFSWVTTRPVLMSYSIITMIFYCYCMLHTGTSLPCIVFREKKLVPDFSHSSYIIFQCTTFSFLQYSIRIISSKFLFFASKHMSHYGLLKAR